MGTQPGCEAEQIDITFKPGKKANAEIAEFVGYEADFCGSEDALVAILEDMQIFDAMFQLQDDSGQFFCVFEEYGELFTTRTYKKSTHALAAVAHFLVTR